MEIKPVPTVSAPAPVAETVKIEQKKGADPPTVIVTPTTATAVEVKPIKPVPQSAVPSTARPAAVTNASTTSLYGDALPRKDLPSEHRSRRIRE